MALKEVGSDLIQNMWVVLRKLEMDDKKKRGDLAWFMVWRSGAKKYVEDYAIK